MSDSVRTFAEGDVPGPPRTSEPTLAPVRQLRPGRGRIVEEARRLFSTRGYEGTPLRAVSDALGLTKAAVYYHFKAKDELLVAIVGPLLDEIDQMAEPMAAGEASEREFLRSYVEVLSKAPDVTALLLRDPAVADHAVGRRFADQHVRMRAILGAGPTLAAGIRAAVALRALEVAVVDFAGADPDQVQRTALDIAVAVLQAGRGDA